MTVKLPLITIIIPNYNHGEVAVNAIKSVCDQDYPYKQIVVIDDKSTDNSCDILSKALNIDPTLSDNDDFVYGKIDTIQTYLIKLPKNQGRAAARNAGIKPFLENSHLFGFLDADDEYLEGKISKSVVQILQDPKVIGVVYSDYISYNKDTGHGVVELRPPFDIVKMRQNCLINNDSIVNGFALRNIGLYDESMEVAEDYDLWLRMTTKFLAVHIPEVLLKVNISATNATKTVPNHIWRKNWDLIGARMKAGMY